jgi:serine/threonine protein kinase
MSRSCYLNFRLMSNRHHQVYALKILTAESSVSSNELTILQYLRATRTSKGEGYITILIDSFQHKGPNGLHQCLVFEPMGASVNSMVEELPWFKPRRFDMEIRYPTWMAKRILKQALQGLEFLHANNVVHGDLQPGNMLFTVKDLKAFDPNVLGQDENFEGGAFSPPVERLDRKDDKWAPRYLAVCQPLTGFINIGPDFGIKLSDFGGCKSYYLDQIAILTILT